MGTWRIAVLCFLLLVCVDSQRRRRRKSYGLSREEWLKRQIKAQGPHVCAIEKVSYTSSRFYTPWTNGYHCGRPTEIRFECCQGFELLPQEPGCSLVKPLENLVESVRGNGASAFAHGISESGLELTLSTEGPYTLFAPANHAFLNASDELIAMLSAKTAIKGATPSLLLYHLVPNRILVDELHNGMLLETHYYGQPLRVHKFPSGLVTINCVPLVGADLEATNGVVHKVENFLRPPTQRSITDYLFREPLFGRLATYLVQSKMSEVLRDMGPVTLFAPTDDAFAALPHEELEALVNDSQILRDLLAHHLVPEIWCTSFLMDKATAVAVDNEELHLSCVSNNKLVENANILQSDILAGDGFVHIIDQVLIPNNVKSLRVISQDLPVTIFLTFLKMAAMENVLYDKNKFTIFAPVDDAFEALSNETTQELLTNPIALQDLIMSHLVPGEFTINNVVHKQKLNTLKRKRRLRIRLHRQRISVDGVLIRPGNHRARNGVIHLVDQILFPLEITISTYLKNEPSLSGFTGALNLTSPPLLEVLESSKGGPYTVFATDNYALSLLPPGHLERVIQESHLLNKVMADHIVPDYIITTALLPNVVYTMRTRSNRVLHMREDEGIVSVEGGIVTSSNIRCSNGVIHVINRVIQI